MNDVIILGAGAAGLMAAKTLTSSGLRVILLEARDRTGGRIHTHYAGAYVKPIEYGAEFIHGHLTTTLDLLREAGIPYHPLDGELWHYTDGRFHQDDHYAEHWPLLLEKLHALRHDCSLSAFLDRTFGGEQYASLRHSATRFAEGYDAADPDEVSVFSLREEWSGEDETQYRIDGGYGKLIRYLETACTGNGAELHLSAVARAVQWSDNAVTVVCEDGRHFEAARLIITVPPNLISASCLEFSPAIPAYLKAAGEIGCGHVIKFSLQFRNDFWHSTKVAKLRNLQMLLTDEEIPTWWTQYPERNALLVGWIGGPKALAMSDHNDETLLDKALYTLSRIFNLPTGRLKDELDAWHIANWPSEPFTQCAYAYEKPGTPAARKLLATPVNGRIFFAGEAMYEGAAKGTVEAALVSGRQVARQLLEIR